MMFFYLVNNYRKKVDNLPMILIPYYHVMYDCDRASSSWFQKGQRHEEFKVGDYGSKDYGLRKLSGYVHVYYVELDSYQAFEKYIEKIYKNCSIVWNHHSFTKLEHGINLKLHLIVDL